MLGEGEGGESLYFSLISRLKKSRRREGKKGDKETFTFLRRPERGGKKKEKGESESNFFFGIQKRRACSFDTIFYDIEGKKY